MIRRLRAIGLPLTWCYYVALLAVVGAWSIGLLPTVPTTVVAITLAVATLGQLLIEVLDD